VPFICVAELKFFGVTKKGNLIANSQPALKRWHDGEAS